jgi:hypothetical protein
MADAKPHRWQFATRFRRNAFGWRSQPAIERVREAVLEIKKTARRDPILAATGAVVFLEKCALGKGHFRTLRARRRRKPAPFGAAGRTVDQYRAKPLQREVVRPIRELEQESQNGNSG